MAFSVETVIGTPQNIATKLQNLINSASITTLHSAGILKLYGSDRVMGYIIYE